jgi:hypothetical protein
MKLDLNIWNRYREEKALPKSLKDLVKNAERFLEKNHENRLYLTVNGKITSYLTSDGKGYDYIGVRAA